MDLGLIERRIILDHLKLKHCLCNRLPKGMYEVKREKSSIKVQKSFKPF